MAQIKNKQLQKFMEENIHAYHDRLFQKLQSLKLNDVLKRKNPYLFKAKALESAPDLVKMLLDAFISSQEETVFGDFLEKLSIFVCRETYGGTKSSSEGIDLDFIRDNKRYIVSIKSGPNWGNSSQIKRLLDNFKKAKKILGTNAQAINVVPVNGCCYGKEKSNDKGDYLKLCGQDFWELISGEEKFYQHIIEPLGANAKKRNDDFALEYAKVINKFTKAFMENFCKEDGAIDWDKLLEFNSGRTPPKAKKGIS